MDFGTVPSVTVCIFDILLGSAETLSERRVLETGHGWRGMAMRRVREQVAYVVAVISQEKTRDQTCTRRVVFVGVEFVSPPTAGRKIDRKCFLHGSCSPLARPHDA